jgi:phosphatidylglycerol:prolipoprotein diacylglycerol transferase
MHPKLIEIPFVHLTVWSFGAMAALGFLAGLLLVRRLTRRAGLDMDIMSNAALYALIVGMIGARAFFVLHYFESFRNDLWSVFAIWRGGLEFLGGVLPATAILWFYLRRHKQPVGRYLDIMAMGLMLGLAFGRIGCFLNGCCYGKPTDLPWGVRLPYGSYAYRSQIRPDPARNRSQPHLALPDEYFGYINDQNDYVLSLRPRSRLTPQQAEQVTHGRYRCLPVHPTQLYSFAQALLVCGLLYTFWHRCTVRSQTFGRCGRLSRPGVVAALTFVLYGVGRPFLESLRDDNPYEIGTLTISQLIGLAMFLLGIALLAVILLRKADAQSEGADKTQVPASR